MSPPAQPVCPSPSRPTTSNQFLSEPRTREYWLCYSVHCAKEDGKSKRSFRSFKTSSTLDGPKRNDQGQANRNPCENLDAVQADERRGPRRPAAGRRNRHYRSLPGTLRYPRDRSSHKRHDRPATQHSQEVNGHGQEGDGLREVPRQEIDCDDVHVLDREHADHRQEGQEDHGLYESHDEAPVRRG
jgi:hypothetical protein